MGYQGLNLIRYKPQKPLGESKSVVVTPINIQAKLWSFPSRNRPAIGFLVGPTEVIIYPDMRTYDFIYSRIQNDFGWLSLEEVIINGATVSRIALENSEARYNIEWDKVEQDETSIQRWESNGGPTASETQTDESETIKEATDGTEVSKPRGRRTKRAIEPNGE